MSSGRNDIIIIIKEALHARTRTYGTISPSRLKVSRAIHHAISPSSEKDGLIAGFKSSTPVHTVKSRC